VFRLDRQVPQWLGGWLLIWVVKDGALPLKTLYSDLWHPSHLLLIFQCLLLNYEVDINTVLQNDSVLSFKRQLPLVDSKHFLMDHIPDPPGKESNMMCVPYS
jgi:hypothetical protein